MADLASFIRARLDEWQAMAKDRRYVWPTSFEVALNPACVLRLVAAMRAIMDETFRYEAMIDGEWGDCHSADQIAAGECGEIDPSQIATLRSLAAIWSDHPDYASAMADTPASHPA